MEKAKEKQLQMIKAWLEDFNQASKSYIKEIEKAKTVKEIEKAHKDLVWMCHETGYHIALEHYYCHATSCGACPYGQKHGKCLEPGSDFNCYEKAYELLVSLFKKAF